LISLINTSYEGGVQPSSTVSWSFANAASGSGFSDAITDPTQQALVAAAFATWSAASGINFVEDAPGSASNISIGFAQNLASQALGLTFLTVNDSGYIASGTTVQLQDPAYTPLYAGSNGLTYEAAGTNDEANPTFEQLALHEIGHALGLGESSDPYSIMNPLLSPQNETLDATDYDNVETLYPGNVFATTAPTSATPPATPPTLTATSLTSGLTDYTSTAASPQFLYGGSDALSVVASGANASVTTGSGNDRIAVSSGENALNGGAGSNLLIGGTGTDSFSSILTASNAWTTTENFHPGDSMVLWGFLAGVSSEAWAGVFGSPELQGETLSVSSGFGNMENITFAGVGSTALANFAMAEGQTAAGVPYLIVGDLG
jgi:hypothetical protein